MPAENPCDDSGDGDPRKLRSRARLLDAAVALLKSEGVEGVTVDAVTTLSKVARTTLYRHFGSAMQLRAAALECLLPAPQPPTAVGSLRDRLIELTHRQAVFIDETPQHTAALAWLTNAGTCGNGAGPHDVWLRQRVVEQYRQPFDELFGSAAARDALGDFDTTAALAQLVGPLVFLRITGLGRNTRAFCAQLVDDFLSARSAAATTGTGAAQLPA
ncbi:TetR/AcrR family transcriptional regulator [Nocardia wallacei]|uniref:TetR/AcrR family transcriptional regulator n=1 Tax=Nocardia wallacei TaxID=480035 RepID=UPI0024577B59|nr:TetR/AcrR family transcriptional regulator [Nocardia wallacei]